ncbi:MAG: recombinase family protein, partial [Candidatus Sericytochromatia bacterium]|nr:recombinase family protein [Candidatus Tanganyikabacteria bacterium]
RHLPRSEWAIVIPDHHKGFIDWQTFEANVARIGANTRPRRHEPGTGAVREGAALLQGIATCGRCGRKLGVYYSGRNSSPSYHCTRDAIVNGRGEYCQTVGGRQIDDTVTSAFLAALAPAGLEASLRAVELVEADNDAALAQWRRQVERARYEAQRAERRYRAVDPDNRLVARGLEAEWESCLRALQDAQTELERREQQRPRSLSAEDRAAILALGRGLDRVWTAPATTDRDRKELLRTLLDEVIVAVDREKEEAHLTLRWRGGLVCDVELALTPSQPAPNRTDEETIDLVRRLAVHYPDAVIAGILNRQGRTTATGLRFTTNRVQSLRAHWGVARFEPPAKPPKGEPVSIQEAARLLGVAPSTLHRCVNDGIVPGEQLTPGAPWRIRMTDELRALFVEEPPEGYAPIVDAMRILGVSRQTVLQRVKRGEIEAIHVSRGRRKGLRIKVPPALPGLFDL